MSAAKPILISGGGLASLLLAQSLRLSKIPFHIFERDASFVFRAQGYRLRLSAEGLDAIESVLDAETWQKFWDKCGKTGGAGFSSMDAITGEVLQFTAPEQLSSRGGKVVGIARGDMRQAFSEGLESHIQWNRKVTAYELTENGVYAIFDDGTKSVEGSMLIAGDGIYSKIAKQVSGGKLKTYDTGARGVHGQAPTTAFKGLGEGVFRVKDTSRSEGSAFIITNVRAGDMDDADLEFGWTMGGDPGVIRAPNDDYTIVGEVAANIAKDITKNWDPKFKPLFEQMNVADAAFWKITCSTPSGVPVWSNQPRVTVIGDAAHSMTPAGGLGANTAVQDSALLGKLLKEAGGYEEGITAKYEEQMRIYGSAAVAESFGIAKREFGVSINEETSPVV